MIEGLVLEKVFNESDINNDVLADNEKVGVIVREMIKLFEKFKGFFVGNLGGRGND